MSKKNKQEQFFQHMEKLLGSEEARQLIEALDRKNPKAVRYNRRIVSPETLHGEPVPWCEPFGRYWDGDLFPSRTLDYAVGKYYIQEASAMLPVSIASMVMELNGKIVLDLTAAPGGKTTQIAEFLETGYLLANEVIRKRVDALVWNVNRHRLDNVVITSLGTEVLADALPRFFDVVFVDAPCSGEGLFQKKKHSPVKWSQKNVRFCAQRQRTILDDATKLVCPEGFLVYSTCTFSQEENEAQVEYLLENGFEPVPLPTVSQINVSPAISENPKVQSCSRRIFPHRQIGAGAFVAILKKLPQGDGAVPRTGCMFHHPKKDAAKQKAPTVLDIESIGENLYEQNGIISYFPHHRLPTVIHENAFQIGAPLFDKRRDNEPMYGAVQFPSKETSIQLNEKEAIDYAHGLELRLNSPDGYYWLTHNGTTLGGTKISNGRAVNKFPKPLRII